jgi:hypothetical protein
MFFDTASRQYCTVKPLRTNSPLHALATLDDDTYVEAARAMAGRVLARADASPDSRVAEAFQLTLARKPNVRELELLVRGLQRLKSEFAADPASAKKFLSVGESRNADNLDPIEHAAYASLCLEILNLDETLTKE